MNVCHTQFYQVVSPPTVSEDMSPFTLPPGPPGESGSQGRRG